MNYSDIIEKTIKESIDVKYEMGQQCMSEIIKISELITNCLREKGTIFLFGNGGSAADSQHIAAEFIGKFNKERGPLPAEALTTNTSIITAIGNDYDFSQIFSRQVETRVHPKDVVVGISTSGKSTNVIKGLIEARKVGAITIGFTGTNENMDECTDISLKVPSTETTRIQESHILAWHIICDIVEQEIEN